MSERIKPALTAAEWADWRELEKGWVPGLALIRDGFQAEPLFAGKPRGINLSACSSSSGDPDQVRGKACHALAAIALYGQPFGFKREDAELLRNDVIPSAMFDAWSPEQVVQLESLADRIEALLPPESP